MITIPVVAADGSESVVVLASPVVVVGEIEDVFASG